MSKISLIIEREYKTRVFKKSFILLTFLTPLLLAALTTVPIWLAQIDSTDEKRIVVIDHSGLYAQAFPDDDVYTFEFTSQGIEQVKTSEEASELTGVLIITDNLVDNPHAATLYSEKQANVEVVGYIERTLSDFVEDQKIALQNIPDLKRIMRETHTELDVATVKWTNDGEEKEGSAELALIVGMITSLVIYMFIVIYGAQVMSGVVQEKTNRIVEVIISSVKPFELMMGKIIGIALVGLTQVFLWVALTLVLTTVASTFMGGADAEQISQVGTEVVAAQVDVAPDAAAKVFSTLSGFNFTKLLVLFIVYFLGGYLLYASLFAAIGSTVDNETDTNQFSLVLTIPIIFAMYAAIYSAQNPDGPLAFWCSMVPFTSPIVMMVRIPFDVAWWEVALSLTILVGSFIGSTWIAGKIYRTGILMYGKKATWGELWKWLRY